MKNTPCQGKSNTMNAMHLLAFACMCKCTGSSACLDVIFIRFQEKTNSLSQTHGKGRQTEQEKKLYFVENLKQPTERKTQRTNKWKWVRQWGRLIKVYNNLADRDIDRPRKLFEMFSHFRYIQRSWLFQCLSDHFTKPSSFRPASRTSNISFRQSFLSALSNCIANIWINSNALAQMGCIFFCCAKYSVHQQ